ncbi:hypothetical protein J437_LFUL015987 [Ladona fulva]|uniref:UBC core domain-containing protein n=1 Tax=Ladona fulva TaxID=123851 RepID=A0A8K0KNB8_LADFU|nr:hypothetical protein J437_LFUL015987 [Ladona fulva]
MFEGNMETKTTYNPRSPAVKRLMREAVELREPAEEYYVQPLEDNLFEWHFTIHGPPSTEFEGGIYHGRIVLPSEYPMKPPNIIILTPNGRFETNKNICLSISGHHPETWQPSWSIRTALLALIAFMPTPGNGMIGALDYTVEERKALARRSHSWQCPVCGNISNLFRKRSKSSLCIDESMMNKIVNKDEIREKTGREELEGQTDAQNSELKKSKDSSELKEAVEAGQESNQSRHVVEDSLKVK